MDTHIQPSSEPTLEPGPALRPASALLAWLESSAGGDDDGRRLFRLPVVVRFEDRYRLALGAAHIAASTTAIAPDAIALAAYRADGGYAAFERARPGQVVGQDEHEKGERHAAGLEQHRQRRVEQVLVDVIAGHQDQGEPLQQLKRTVRHAQRLHFRFPVRTE